MVNVAQINLYSQCIQIMTAYTGDGVGMWSYIVCHCRLAVQEMKSKVNVLWFLRLGQDTPKYLPPRFGEDNLV